MEKPPSKKTPSPTAQPFVPGRQTTRTSSFTSPPTLPPLNAGSAASKPRVNLPASQVPCRYFAAGYCQRGPTCFYKHDLSSLTLPGLENADKGKKTREPPENTDTCAICYEIPATYGLLTSCDHVFCLCKFAFFIIYYEKMIGTDGIFQHVFVPGDLRLRQMLFQIRRVVF